VGPRLNRRTVTYVAVALAVLTGLFFILVRPIGPRDDAGPATSSATSSTQPTSTTATSSTTTKRAGSCLEGNPARLVYPALGVNAPFERIGVDRTLPPDANGRYPLGNPKDRKKAGWYADGPRPGSGRGTVLTNGHTFRNGSAIFKENFAARIAQGQVIKIIQDNGSTCSYVVQRLWREVDAKRDYPRIVTSQNLYDFTGPERLFLATCGGSWNSVAQNYDEISLLIATPVDR
jgi:hypothetical protein